MSVLPRAAGFGGALGLGSLVVLASCIGDGITDNPIGANAAGPSQAFGVWSPGPGDTCTKADHDRYSVIGPDGKRYPTWHPPVDPVTGCRFGHEHGRDPHGSKLYASIGDVPFGLADEALDTWDPSHPRHEDHGGHKIEWENGVMLQQSVNGQRVDIGVRCDFLVKIHQGTHSGDAFSNTLHELVYHVKCDDGTEIHVTILVDKDSVSVNSIITPDGEQLAYFDPHFAVFAPSRFFDPAKASLTGRLIDACHLVESNGDRAHGGECELVTSLEHRPGVSYDDPQSGFSGVHREVYFNQTGIYNADGPTTWYTDPFGGNARTVPFPGSIRQFIAAVNNDRGFPLESQAFGGDRNYGGPGVHAPN